MNVDTLGRENLRQVSHLHRDTLRGWSPSTTWLRSPTLAAAVLLGLISLVLRLAYAASQPTDVNGLRDVLGSSHFDVTRHSPTAPGSWLYVAAGHALHVVTGASTVHCLVYLAALASAAGAGLACVAGTALGGRWVGIAVGVIVASAPVSWFAGATVSTYSIDAFLASLLIVLARRARPYRAHGVVAALALGFGAGVHLTVVPAFLLLAVIAVVGSVRTLGQLLAVVIAAVVSVAAWFVPIVVIQPGGIRPWLHAVHVQISGAAHASSVFVAPSARILTNIGTFGGWTLVSLAPVIVLAVVAVIVLTVARLITRQPGGNASMRIWAVTSEPLDRIERPWYQTTGVILALALIPPLALVTLGQFSQGGAVLLYLVPATLLLLLPVARLLHHRAGAVRRGAAVVATLLVAGIVVGNVQRFVSAPGILPTSIQRHYPHLWISQTRYQSPYADTAATIRAADRTHRQSTAGHRRKDRRPLS